MLVLLPVFNHVDTLAASSGELCGTLGFTSNCFDIAVYSAGIAGKDGEIIGVPVEIDLAVTRGSGAVFVHVEPVFDEDLALFTKISALVASAVAGRRFSDYNYYVLIKSPTAVARGPSLSAAIGLGFALALLEVEVGKPVAATGILMPDGGIGPVGHLVEKIVALSAVAGKIYVPAAEVGAQLGGTSLNLTELGRTLGVEIVGVSALDEVLRHLGIEVKYATADIALPLSEVLVKLASYLTTALERTLEEVAEVCGESAVSELGIHLELLKNSTSTVRAIGYATSALLRARSTAWLCRIERGSASLADLVHLSLEKLRLAEGSCHFYSRIAGFEFGRVVAYSTICLHLLDAWEEFNESSEALDLVGVVRGLVRSVLTANIVAASLNLLSGEGLEEPGRDLESRRVLLLFNYTSALLDSLRVWLAESASHSRHLDLLQRYLQVGAGLTSSSPSLSLAYVLKVLYELNLFLYLTYYVDSLRVESIRGRALVYADLSKSSVVRSLVEFGDSCAEAGWGFSDCLEAYLKASTLGFAITYLSATRAPTPAGYGLVPVYAAAAVLVLSVAIALLSRRGRVFSSPLRRPPR
ncbi:MAG: hypothetical protein RMH84_04470 [Sulfolobales archaeon]|nr:hypothetical protein [Sulfolobales archaeon]MCX8209257.1 hypothetical protein [Sulfolobales archaeon]MDW8010829.1 hypothetical protein [Sulfolobales archaeon]